MAWFNNTTTQDIPQESPNQTTIHNYAPGWAGLLLAASVVVIIAAWLLQVWLTSLLGKLGAADPDAMFALLVLAALLGVPALLLVNWILHGWAASGHQRRMELESARLDKLELLHRMQSSANNDTRELDPETKRRNALIVALVADGLAGEHNFSYRKAGGYTLIGEDSPVGKDSVTTKAALGWLRERGAIKNNKLIDGVWRSIGEVQRELYAPPVLTK